MLRKKYIYLILYRRTYKTSVFNFSNDCMRYVVLFFDFITPILVHNPGTTPQRSHDRGPGEFNFEKHPLNPHKYIATSKRHRLTDRVAAVRLAVEIESDGARKQRPPPDPLGRRICG